uniref:Uncharacterized protein n=1 Tax=Knipowitschia caucasica TaxID=637954 RepID=A0AAV2MDD2_KNICA
MCLKHVWTYHKHQGSQPHGPDWSETLEEVSNFIRLERFYFTKSTTPDSMKRLIHIYTSQRSKGRYVSWILFCYPLFDSLDTAAATTCQECFTIR